MYDKKVKKIVKKKNR